MTPFRLIVDPPQEGAWNMAVDESLLDDAATGGAASLRFYQWREPTLSLGYFQKYEDRYSHEASREVNVVRRLSGGGALLHDHEVTYSVCLPAGHPYARQSQRLYAVVHRTVIESIADSNVAASLHGDQDPAVERSDEPFLCFARRTAADVIVSAGCADVASIKIVGSAQRRRRGAVLQHGAILLGRSCAAPELPGINDLAGGQITADELISRLRQPLAASLQLQLQPTPLTGELRKTAQRLQAEKYASRSWTERR